MENRSPISKALDAGGIAALAVAILALLAYQVAGTAAEVLEMFWFSLLLAVASLLVSRILEIFVHVLERKDVVANRACASVDRADEVIVSIDDVRTSSADESIEDWVGLERRRAAR